MGEMLLYSFLVFVIGLLSMIIFCGKNDRKKVATIILVTIWVIFLLWIVWISYSIGMVR